MLERVAKDVAAGCRTTLSSTRPKRLEPDVAADYWKGSNQMKRQFAETARTRRSSALLDQREEGCDCTELGRLELAVATNGKKSLEPNVEANCWNGSDQT